jgi:hypothetical protein
MLCSLKRKEGREKKPKDPDLPPSENNRKSGDRERQKAFI